MSTMRERLIAQTTDDQIIHLRWLATLVTNLPAPPDAEEWADLQAEARKGLGQAE